jgi:hypothetical protein
VNEAMHARLSVTYSNQSDCCNVFCNVISVTERTILNFRNTLQLSAKLSAKFSAKLSAKTFSKLLQLSAKFSANSIYRFRASRAQSGGTDATTARYAARKISNFPRRCRNLFILYIYFGLESFSATTKLHILEGLYVETYEVTIDFSTVQYADNCAT